jgi:hypothetical protein
MLARYSASSTAVLPPPITATGWLLVEETIAGGTADTPLPDELLFRRQAEILGRSAGGNDQGIAGVLAGIADQA